LLIAFLSEWNFGIISVDTPIKAVSFDKTPLFILNSIIFLFDSLLFFSCLLYSEIDSYANNGKIQSID